MAGRKGQEPGWVADYLAALARTGNARLAAAEAGIDHTTAYQRRLKHAEFGAAWAAALEQWRTAGPAAGRSMPGPRQAKGGQELVERVSANHGPQLVRAGVGRWSKRAEEAFLNELAACANVKRSAAAAGFSVQALFKRRRRDQGFAAAWDEAVAIAGTRIHAYLVEAADRTFDPADSEDLGDAPKMTVAEAIKIMQLGQAKTSRAAGGKADGRGYGWMGDEEWGTPEEEEQRMAELREGIIGRLDRFRELEEEKKLESGWTRHGDEWVPPGFVPVVEAVALPVLDEGGAEVAEETEKAGPRVRGL